MCFFTISCSINNNVSLQIKFWNSSGIEVESSMKWKYKQVPENYTELELMYLEITLDRPNKVFNHTVQSTP